MIQSRRMYNKFKYVNDIRRAFSSTFNTVKSQKKVTVISSNYLFV